MKYFTIFTLLLFNCNCFSQSDISKLLGKWKIEKVINSTDSGVSCNAVSNYTLTFNKDFTYTFDAGPEFITTGKWKLEGNKINFFDNKLSDATKGTVANHAYIYKIMKDGRLVIDEYMCSELGGKTYYLKIL